jgi:hypothetical protein
MRYGKIQRALMLKRLGVALAAVALGAAGCAETDTIEEGRFGHDGTGGQGAGSGQGAFGNSPSSSSTSDGPSAGSTMTTTTTTGTTTEATTTTTTTTTATTTSTGSGGSPTCIDTGPGEPNDTEGDATFLGNIDDCDTSGGSIKGTLAGDDVDWYSYGGTDASFCTVDPTRSVTAQAAIRVCKFVKCDSGDEDLICPAGTTAENSPSGKPGCCSTSDFVISPDCDGPASDNMTIYIRLTKQPADNCVPYDLSYHY